MLWHQGRDPSYLDLGTDLLLGELGLIAVQCRPNVPTAIRPVTNRAMISIQPLGLTEIFSTGSRRYPQYCCYPEGSYNDMFRVI